MINKHNIEKFYDYFDEVANLLYENYHKTYLEGMNEAFNLLLDDKFNEEYRQEDIDALKVAKTNISGIAFEREEIRKSVQLGLLKGYKHAYMSNALITPDTIGIFVGYIVEKLYKNQKLENVLDPMIGSGNLIFTALNHMKKSLKIYGVDNDLLMCNLVRNIADLQEYKNEVFYQDTLTYFDQGFDLILTDLPISQDVDYFPYKAINHHIDSLTNGGYLIALIENDFFEKKDIKIFQSEVNKKAYMFGLIKLSETLFKNNPKSILIIRKKLEGEIPPKEFLLIDLPSFNDTEGINNSIIKIDEYFKKREEE
jgi:site-specific DNA-methyltransferase (adenine-specific)